MPCYDAPPPWEGEQKKNAEQAVGILCRHVTAALDAGLIVPHEVLWWYLAHRQIDLVIATSSHYREQDPVAAEEAKRDIERTKLLLESEGTDGEN